MRALLRLAGVLLVAVLVLGGTGAHAQERILRFVSDIKIERNGDLVVAETIRVLAEGNAIKRGILRDFPTSYTNRDGSHIEIGFDVQSVTRDGRSEHYTTERLSNGYRVRIGSADTLLSTGQHEYVITYRTTRQIGFFKDFDEFYWNVTGTGWTFAIDVAEARITLPEAVPFGENAVYTGAQGARERNAQVVEKVAGRIVFRTTAPLPPRNGLTVAAAFQKGIITPPTEAERWMMWARDNAPIAATLAAVAAMLAFLGVAWLAVGRDPRRGTMVPLFAPPKGMSAPAVRYVDRMETDDKTFAAAMVDIAVRGHARLVEKKKGTGMRILARAGGTPLPPDEAAMKKKLLARDDVEVEVSDKNHGLFERARNALNGELKQTYEDKLFHRNSGWVTLGSLLAIVLCIGVVLTAYWGWGSADGGRIASCMGTFVPAVIVLSVLVIKGWPASVTQYVLLAVGVVIAGGFALSGLVIVGFGSWGIWQAVPAFAPVVLIPLAATATQWMRAYTPEGRRIADQIDGFRHYLSVAERDRLNALNPPQETAELFEKYLPYAIALDVENAWGRRFAGVLAAAAVGAAVGHTIASQDSWYQGQRDWSDWSSDPGGFANYLGSGFSETIAAAATPPAATTSPSSDWGSSSSSSSSSGSDGGGSSGGGGGGGGGSGW